MKIADDSQVLVTIAQCAGMMGVSKYMVRSLLADGSLKGVRLGRCIRVRVDSIEKLCGGHGKASARI